MYTVHIPNNPTCQEWTEVTKFDGAKVEYKHFGNAKRLARQMVEQIKHIAAQIRDENGEVIAVVGACEVQPITMAQALKTPLGIFIKPDGAGYTVSVHLFDRTTYLSPLFRLDTEALTDAHRLRRMYTNTPVYSIEG